MLVVLLHVFLAAAFVLGRSDLPLVQKVKVYFRNIDEEHKRWWKETTKTLWLTAQTCSLFLGVESVHLPAPFSWLVSVMDFLTLGPLASFFFSPCASSFCWVEDEGGSRRRRGSRLVRSHRRRGSGGDCCAGPKSVLAL